MIIIYYGNILIINYYILFVYMYKCQVIICTDEY